MNSQTFGEFIRQRRIEKKLSQRQLAKTLGISNSTLGKIERSQTIANPSTIEPLAKILNYPYNKLQTFYLSDKILKLHGKAPLVLDALNQATRLIEQGVKYPENGKSKQDFKAIFKTYFINKPVKKAWLFGSYARNNFSQLSDIDILVEYAKPNKLSIFDIIEMKQELTMQTGKKIDLVDYKQLNDTFKNDVNKHKILVYAR